MYFEGFFNDFNISMCLGIFSLTTRWNYLEITCLLQIFMRSSVFELGDSKVQGVHEDLEALETWKFREFHMICKVHKDCGIHN